MGNCQAAEAATVVIQHPGGKVQRLYGPATTAADVMRTNPGHYVALVILRVSADKDAAAPAGDAKITRVKLLKPKDALLLGQVYRLITSQEVTKALRARKNEKMRRCGAIRQQHDPLADVVEPEQSPSPSDQTSLPPQDAMRDKVRRRSSGAPPSMTGRGRPWRPSLQSISETASHSSSSSSISESAAS
ncbi:hypothetical protein GUJ93_ZPchr0009g2383 [Zizania palustris]|uniref:Uncharacterized protein n=1 Tax=Zizania palustris TaxID=103762 RepID=A0A8J5V6Y5_ZIZPA|nr:hypothetical protein GUJ93_ZPchr0009g2383 [Zizania palustris]